MSTDMLRRLTNGRFLLLSRLVERVVVRRFPSRAAEFNLLPSKGPFQSTETAILSVYNDVVRAIDIASLF